MAPSCSPTRVGRRPASSHRQRGGGRDGIRSGGSAARPSVLWSVQRPAVYSPSSSDAVAEGPLVRSIPVRSRPEVRACCAGAVLVASQTAPLPTFMRDSSQRVIAVVALFAVGLRASSPSPRRRPCWHRWHCSPPGRACFAGTAARPCSSRSPAWGCSWGCSWRGCPPSTTPSPPGSPGDGVPDLRGRRLRRARPLGTDTAARQCDRRRLRGRPTRPRCPERGRLGQRDQVPAVAAQVDIIVLSLLSDRRRPGLTTAALLALGLLNILNDARSAFGFCVIAAALVLCRPAPLPSAGGRIRS